MGPSKFGNEKPRIDAVVTEEQAQKDGLAIERTGLRANLTQQELRRDKRVSE